MSLTPYGHLSVQFKGSPELRLIIHLLYGYR